MHAHPFSRDWGYANRFFTTKWLRNPIPLIHRGIHLLPRPVSSNRPVSQKLAMRSGCLVLPGRIHAYCLQLMTSSAERCLRIVIGLCWEGLAHLASSRKVEALSLLIPSTDCRRTIPGRMLPLCIFVICFSDPLRSPLSCTDIQCGEYKCS